MRAVIQTRAICKIGSSSAPQNHQSQRGHHYRGTKWAIDCCWTRIRTCVLDSVLQRFEPTQVLLHEVISLAVHQEHLRKHLVSNPEDWEHRTKNGQPARKNAMTVELRKQPAKRSNYWSRQPSHLIYAASSFNTFPMCICWGDDTFLDSMLLQVEMKSINFWMVVLTNGTWCLRMIHVYPKRT